MSLHLPSMIQGMYMGYFTLTGVCFLSFVLFEHVLYYRNIFIAIL